jgi:hypothetical protein
VKLREHPLLNFGAKASSWPPAWIGTRTVPPRRVQGEVGILKDLIFDDENLPRRLFLVIEFEKERFMGCLLVAEATFCKQLREVLRQCIGQPIKEIGDFDVSFTL